MRVAFIVSTRPFVPASYLDSFLKEPEDVPTLIADIIGSLFVCPVDFEKSRASGVHQRGSRPKAIVVTNWADQFLSKLRYLIRFMRFH
jgi:hypothetical protein